MDRKFNKIFQIGFNKCGTTSIHNFFLQNGLKSIHWDNTNLAKTIKNNSDNNQPLLSGYEQYDCFTDMESLGDHFYIYLTHYKELDKQYPNSKFILNVRDKEKWIKSRMKHNNYLEYFRRNTGLNTDGVINLWHNQWDNHISDVLEYFSDRNDDLLHFNIETENEKFVYYMKNLIDIKNPKFTKENQTKTKFFFQK
jgi:hypothetical protein